MTRPNVVLSRFSPICLVYMHDSLGREPRGRNRFGKKAGQAVKKRRCCRRTADSAERSPNRNSAPAYARATVRPLPHNPSSFPRPSAAHLPGVPATTLAAPASLPYIFSCFAVLALFRLSATALTDHAAGIERGYQPFLFHLAGAIVWTFTAYALFALVDRFPPERMRLGSLLTIVVPVVLLATLTRLTIEAFMTMALSGNPGWPVERVLPRVVTRGFHPAFLETLVVWGLGQGIRSYLQRRSVEHYALQLERELARAELESLRAQIRPHFLFNALHSVISLIGVDPEAAKRMIARLSELLRLSLATSDRQVVPLQHELEIADRYLAVQQVRFGESLRVVIDVAEDCLDAAVPPFILQPLLENSIVHGVEETDGRPCTVTIRAERQQDQLRLEIADDGPGPSPSMAEGIGLSNTRERLAVLYGQPASLTILRDRGFATILRIPFDRIP